MARPRISGRFPAAKLYPHANRLAGTYSIDAVMIDSANNTTVVSTSVAVIPVPRPTITITCATHSRKSEYGDKDHDSSHGGSRYRRNEHKH